MQASRWSKSAMPGSRTFLVSGCRRRARGSWASSSGCILPLSDEPPDLVRDGRTKALAAASLTLEEFLAALPDYRPGRLERRAVVHGHCRQKALVGIEPTRQVSVEGGGAGVQHPGQRMLRDGGLVRLRAGPLRGEPGLRRARALPGGPRRRGGRPGRRPRLQLPPTRSPTSVTTAAVCTRPSCWRRRSDEANGRGGEKILA
jgi:hypothetical protein